MLRTFGAWGASACRPSGSSGRGRILYNRGMSLAARLSRAVTGEVLFDAGSRGRYATDASIYEVEPVGVLVPKTDRRRARGDRDLPRGARAGAAARRRQLAVRADGRRGARDRPQQASVRDHGVRSRRDDRRRRARCGARLAQCMAQAPRSVVSGRRQHVGAGDAGRDGGQQLVRLALDRLRQHGAQRARDRCDPVGRHRSALRLRERDGGRAAADRRALAPPRGDRRARARRDRAQRAEGAAARRRLQHRRLLPAERASVHGGRQRQLRASARRQRRHARLVARAHVEARAAAVAPGARRGQLSDAVQGDGKRAASGRARSLPRSSSSTGR